MEPLDFYQCQFRPKDILMPLLEPSLGCTPFLGHFHANLSPTLLCLRSHFWSVMTLPVFSGSLLTSFHIGIPPHQILACLISSWSLLFGGLVPTHLSSCLVYPGNYANHNLQRVFSGPNLGELITTVLLRSLSPFLQWFLWLHSFNFPPYFNTLAPSPKHSLPWFSFFHVILSRPFSICSVFSQNVRIAIL